MNGRKARALRRWAKQATVGLPERDLVPAGPTATVWRNTPQGPVPMQITGTLRHKPTTTRAVYQKLKKVYGRASLSTLK